MYKMRGPPLSRGYCSLITVCGWRHLSHFVDHAAIVRTRFLFLYKLLSLFFSPIIYPIIAINCNKKKSQTIKLYKYRNKQRISIQESSERLNKDIVWILVGLAFINIYIYILTYMFSRDGRIQLYIYICIFRVFHRHVKGYF